MTTQETIDKFVLESKPLDRAEKIIVSLTNVKGLNLW
jgi:hypothetical protein